ncbi:MAG TPA: CHASE3 domain-containing protein, partial [Brevundimonas sp.]|nr:CHASE3 domain-containing protein [Brevundimonas sp.]
MLTGFELYREFRSAAALRSEVEASYETRSRIQHVFSLLQDAETGQRGYVITGDRRFLEPYSSATQALDAEVSDLGRRVAATPGQDRNHADLLALVRRKRQTLEAGVAARTDGGAAAGAAVVSSGAGQAVMDDIRVVVRRMTAREATELAVLSARAESRTRRTEGLVVLLFMALVVAAAGGFFIGWRYARTREALAARIQATAARQQAVFDSALDAIVTLNPSGSIESINRAAETMFGYDAAELDRRDVALLIDLAANGEGPFHARLGESQGALDVGVVRELTGRRKDGGAFPVDVALTAMDLPNGRHVVAVIRDITERRRVETMKDAFVSTVSHELRTPLTSIAGSLGLLAAGAAGALPDKAVRLVGIAHSNSLRLVRLINDILDVEKLESGNLALTMTELDLREIARRSIEGANGYAEQLGVTLSLAPGDSAPVRGDADRLVQVVTNLLSNAAKFSPAGGTVRVSVHPETRIARLSVADQGPGIPENFRSRIFGKFAQADETDTRAKGGTGLGLAIAKEIAERHGGRLWFESAEGEGATFHLDLPLALDDSAAPAAPGGHLLIVEDDPDAAGVLKEMLSLEGFTADIASTGRQGLSLARTGAYDAALVDLHLPDADGIGLIRSLRARPETRDLPIVVVSGDVGRGRARARSLEVLDWMEKPFDQTRVHGAITAISRAGSRPRVLHVDDDRDILEVTRAALSDAADVIPAESLGAARRLIAEQRPDLVILDLGLPDGSGLDLLPDLVDAAGRSIPVVVYS